MGERPPVADWTRDFDHNHPDWSSDPHAIWDDLRARCPVAHTDRYRGVYLPVRHDDIRTNRLRYGAFLLSPHLDSRETTDLGADPSRHYRSAEAPAPTHDAAASLYAGSNR
jgi:hypothetical protein